MSRSSSKGRQTAPKNRTTPQDAARVQSKTAQDNGGTPAPWVGKLQRAAIKNFGKPGGH
jgi:hypothetical protein